MLRFALVLLAFSGCVSFPYAHLLSAEAQFEAVKSPVVCGPIGFRKIPLQARWGEYVRVTVSSPGALRGTALVHAGGVALEPVSWSTDTTGALVVEARFPNEDPDRRFVLERERPIDVTLTGLKGSCEGSVFTVEQGVLVPSIDERAWMVELERRGGPELAARREAARVEAEARRQAHYAAWEARQHVEVSAELVAQAELIRQQHYAQWDARRTEGGEGLTAAAQITNTTTEVASATATAGVAVTNTSAIASGTVTGVAVTNTSAIASGTATGLAVTNTSATASGNTTASCGTGSLVAVNTRTSGIASSGAIAQSAPICLGTGVTHTTGTEVLTATHDTAATVAFATSPAEWSQPSDVSLRTTTSQTAWAQPSDVSLRATTSQTTWAQPSDASLRATTTQTTWSQPSDAQLRAGVAVEESWSQPYQPRLDTVAVSTETHVVATSGEVQQQEVAVQQQEVEVVQPAAVVVPAMFQLMFNVAASAGSVQVVQQPQPVHGARPAR